MTLTELEALETEVLTCKQIAPVLMANPATIHHQAMECPERLGFPVIVAGSRVKIPRIPFIMFMRGEIKRPVAGTNRLKPQRGEKGQYEYSKRKQGQSSETDRRASDQVRLYFDHRSNQPLRMHEALGEDMGSPS